MSFFAKKAKKDLILLDIVYVLKHFYGNYLNY